jgi:hypothetical protein
MLAGLAAIASGCTGSGIVHPAFEVDQKTVDEAIKLGVEFRDAKADPYKLFNHSTESVNVRLSADLVFLQATCCWPLDEIAFVVAQEGETSKVRLQRTVNEARKRAERELRFLALIQLSKARDPGTVTFALRTNTGQEYQPLVVEPPVLLQEVPAIHARDEAPAEQLAYAVRFPVRGTPGYPPIDPSVRTLTFVVREGGSEGTASFALPAPDPW